MDVGELATEAGLTPIHLRKIERGDNPRTRVANYRALRDALGLTVEDGVFIRGNPGTVPEPVDDAEDAA